MAKAQKTDDTLERLRAENERLRTENTQLRQTPIPVGERNKGRLWQKTLAVVCVALAVALLVAGNLLFWTGNTVVKNDRFNQAVAPVIRNATVQQGIANYTTKQLFANVDVQRTVQDALPAQAAFLAPTIADQVESKTEGTLKKVLARPQFQDHWDTLLSNAHSRFINTVKQSGGNGTIDLNDLYQQLSASLKDTRLSFLAGKQLPPKVGSVQVASGSWIQPLHNLIVHIDAWRFLAILLFIVFAGLAVVLARRKRRMVVTLSLYCAAGMLVTLIAVRIVRENVIGSNVSAQYVDAVRTTAGIVLHPLMVQTLTILLLFVLVALIAWLTGGGRRARYLQSRIQLLFAGKLHDALFGERENAFTLWVGRHKRLLQWGIVAVVAVLVLFVTHLTMGALLVYLLITLVLVLIVELIGAPGRAAG